MARSGHATSESLRQANVDRTDDPLLAVLKQGDERVFSELVEGWSGMMLRVALSHLGDHAVAEDVVQDAWLTALRSLDRFERRSTLSTWVLGIVVNLARSRARAERRTISSPQIRPALG